MQLKLNIKEIDWKQLLLSYGEYIGVGLALLIALPVFSSGVIKFFSSGSATKNAEVMETAALNARKNIDNSPVPEGTNKEPPESKVRITFASADPAEFREEMPWFTPSSIEDTKRRKPDVLAPEDWQVAVVRSGIKINILQTVDGKLKVGAIKSRKVQPSDRVKRRTKQLQQLLGQRGGIGGQPGGMLGQMGGMMGLRGGMGGMGGLRGGMGGMGGQMGGMMGGQMGGMMGGQMGGMKGGPGGGGGGLGGGGLGGGGATINNVEMMDIDQVKEDTRLAENLVPERIAILSASFPYKHQLEAFRIALRFRTLNDLVANLNKDDVAWKFTGFDVQRRVKYADGRIKSDWEDYDKKMVASLTALLAVSAESEKDDEELKDLNIVNPGLAWARPALDPELGSKYPTVEIASVQESKEKLKKLTAETNVKVPSSLQQKLQQKGIDALNPFQTVGNEDAAKEEPSAKQSDSEKKPEGKEEDPAVPEHALVRIVDVTVEPGLTYEYRVRARMANPNYKQNKVVAYPLLAKDKEIHGDWVDVPSPVHVPFDENWYVLEDKPDKERAFVQIHRWVDLLELNRDYSISVADWLILEKLPIHRGEYLGRIHAVEVPTWNPPEDRYELAHDPKSRSRIRLPVDFSVRSPSKAFPALLIDYEGGKGSQFSFEGKAITDDEPIEMLVLTPEGQLIVHSSIDDGTLNDDRKERVEAWKKRIQDVRNGIQRGPKNAPGFDKGMLPGLGK